MVAYNEIAIVIGATSGIVALIMHFRNLLLDRGVLKMSAFVGYTDGSHKQPKNSVSIILLNKGKSKVFIHKFGIREPKRIETLNNIKFQTKGGVYHTVYNDMNTLAIEPNEKKVFHFDGYSELGIQKIINLKKAHAYVVDSNGKESKAIIKQYGL